MKVTDPPAKREVAGAPLTPLLWKQVDRIFPASGYDSPRYICVCNVHLSMKAAKDRRIWKALDRSWMSLADGKPLSVVGNMTYRDRSFERITGPGLLEYLLKRSNEWKLTHFFLGGTPEILQQIRDRLNREDIKGIAGFDSPPFRPMTEEELKDCFDRINRAGPDIIWVGLGAPKQELFMADNLPRLRRGVMIGVGAAFDYYGGRIRRAPRWMQSAGLEWLFRLLQEPRRLWKRYLVTNTRFVFRVILEYLQRLAGRKPPSSR